jgi:hypothetical protein
VWVRRRTISRATLERTCSARGHRSGACRAEIPATSGESNPPASTDEFERKIRCAAYWNETGKEIQSEFAGVVRPPAVGVLVHEIFYSPRLNTCVVAFEVPNPRLYQIRDVLTHETLFDELESDISAGFNYKRWKAKIAELKNRNKYTVEEVK